MNIVYRDRILHCLVTDFIGASIADAAGSSVPKAKRAIAGAVLKRLIGSSFESRGLEEHNAHAVLEAPQVPRKQHASYSFMDKVSALYATSRE